MDQGWKLEVGGSRFEVGGWRFEVRGSRLEVRGWRFEVRGSRFRAKGSVSQFRRNFLFQLFYCLPSLKRPFCFQNLQLPTSNFQPLTSNLQQKRAAFRRKQPVALIILFLEPFLLLQLILLLKAVIELFLFIIQV